MIRPRIPLVLVAVIATAAQAIDWTFWNDDRDSTTEPAAVTDTEILSPEALTSMMGSDYMDRVKSLVLSGDLSAETDKPPTAKPPLSSSSSLMAETVRATPLTKSPSRMPAEYDIATPSTVASNFKPKFRNWVGPWSQAASSACYREAHIMNVCPSNYDRNDFTNTCWTECPMDYPVECGMQCVPQNNDCFREDIAKISAVAMSTLSMATFGVFGELAKLGKKVGWAVRCANMLMTATRAIVRFTRNQMLLDPQTSQEKLLLLLYQTNWVVADLPATIYACRGKTIPPSLQMARGLMPTVQYILLLVLAFDDDIISGWEHFKAFMNKANFTEAASKITEGEISSLETAMKQNSTCSDDLRSATNLVWMTISEYREKSPGISEAEIRLKISQSDLMLYDIPMVTNNCMSQMIAESTEATAYKTREILRKTFGVIVNDLIKHGTSDNGTSLAMKSSAYLWADTALNLASVTGLEPTDLSTLFAEFLQTICGPTQFMGEIDDGTDAATLGLNALKKAFKNSTISWTRKGDGVVIVNLTSKDTEDVTVNIMSGGDKVDEVDVKAGGTAQWKSTVKALGGKTLYMDRWRPSFLGIPSRGSGSLVLWVPIARDGGHLEIEAQLNVS
ncbi:unnamed protein product [Peronospora belbahrii]|uniref:Uncharacterized protein n=1 Tax=Peronospora belbahrii TaxID=622444 RepID=A0AAU9KPM3_9STRA|nr:unnamed protein product [Peronospora belbahrii]CAH0518611.1 unnamed protein product [Peronospora belbahrii]